MVSVSCIITIVYCCAVSSFKYHCTGRHLVSELAQSERTTVTYKHYYHSTCLTFLYTSAAHFPQPGYNIPVPLSTELQLCLQAKVERYCSCCSYCDINTYKLLCSICKVTGDGSRGQSQLYKFAKFRLTLFIACRWCKSVHVRYVFCLPCCVSPGHTPYIVHLGYLPPYVQ